MIRKNLQNKFTWIGVSIFLVVISIFVYTNVTNSASVDKPAFPTVKISTVPETIQPGEETTLSLDQEGFTGQNLFVNWCIDGIPLNTFYAGSSDQITMEDYSYPDPEGGDILNENGIVVGKKQLTKQVPIVKNEWGQVIGGTGYCNYPRRQLNAVNANFHWWGGSQFANIDLDLPWPFKKLDNADEDNANVVIPRAAKAVIIGTEYDESDPMNPTFINKIEGDYELFFEKVDEKSDVGPYGKNAEPQGVAILLATLGETPEAVTGIFEQSILGSFLKFPLNDSRIEGYREEFEANDYRVTGPFDDEEFSRLRLEETFEWYDFNIVDSKVAAHDKLGNLAVPQYHISQPDSHCEDFDTDGDGKHTSKEEKERDCDLEGPEVKVKMFRPVKVQVDRDDFKEYWERIFGVGYNKDIDLDKSDNVAAFYSEIFDEFGRMSYDKNRSIYYSFPAGGARNVLNMSRVFSYYTDEDEEKGWKEGKIYPEEGDPYSNLPKYKDRDGDGIPDLWEMKHFGQFAGKKVVKPTKSKKGERVYFPGCCGTPIPDTDNPEVDWNDLNDKALDDQLTIFLLTVAPGDDWDGDGFNWSNRAYSEWTRKFKGRNTKYAAGLGPVIERRRDGGIVRVGYKGVLTNFEEFVMGTNPIEVDTDQDGVPDELDFYGMDQQSLKVKLQKKNSEDLYEITARAYGPINRGNYEFSSHFARADAITSLKQGGDLPIEIALAITPDPVTISDTITIDAAVGNIQDMDPTLLFFQWYLNDIPIPYPPSEKPGQACPCTEESIKFANFLGQQSGFGKTSFTFPASLGASRACDVANVKLEVTNMTTKQTATADALIPMRMQGVIVKSVGGNAPVYGVGENLGIIKKDFSVDDVSTVDEGGVREDDVLFLKATMVGYDEATCGLPPVVESLDEDGNPVEENTEPVVPLTPEQEYMSALTYIWTIDGIQSEAKSGRGSSVIDFKPSSLPRTSPTDRESADAASEVDDHDVSVEIYDWENNLISFAEEGVKVLGPFIDFNLSGLGVSKEPTNAAGDRTDKVILGEDVTLRADGQYMKPAEAYEFVVTRNGDIVAGPTESQNPIIEYSFIAGETANAQGYEDFEISIVGKSATGSEIENIAGAYTVQVIDEAEEAGDDVEAFLGRFVPSSFKGFINVFAAMSMIAMIYVFAYGYTGPKRRK